MQRSTQNSPKRKISMTDSKTADQLPSPPTECHASTGCVWPDCACQGYTRDRRDTVYFTRQQQAILERARRTSVRIKR
jgi:hypothetical protein